MKSIYHLGGLMALTALLAATVPRSSNTHVIKARQEPIAPRMTVTDGRVKLGKGDKRRARRNGERWT